MPISRRLIKYYPFLFFGDAVVSLCDEFMLIALQSTLLKGVREAFAYFVLFLAIPHVYALFRVRPQDFKKYLLLPVYHVVGGFFAIINIYNLVSSSSIFITFALEISPSSVMSEHPGYFINQTILTLLQFIVGFYVIRFHFKKQEFPPIAPSRPVAGFLLASLLLFIEFTFIIGTIPLLLIASTKGFLGYAEGKITSIERIYTKGDKTLHLVPMIHVGNEDFYKDVSLVDSKDKTLFLLEGVKDKDNLIKNLNYDKFADKLGLDKQGDHFKPQAKNKELEKNITMIVADLDISEFTPESRKFLTTTFEQLNNKSPLEVLFMDSGSFTKQEASYLVMDLMDKRNEKVIEELKKNEDKFAHIYIPWGAAHMPEIERAILKDGYKLQSTQTRPVISLKTILSSKR